MRSVHHRARFRGHGRQVVERVQAHLPRSMQIGRRTAHGEKRLVRRELIAVGPRAHDFAPALFGDAARHRHACEHARLAREELHFALLGTNAQNLAREVDIRNIFGNELVDSKIGYAQHVFPLMRLWRDNYSCFRIAVLAAGASLDAEWLPPWARHNLLREAVSNTAHIRDDSHSDAALYSQRRPFQAQRHIHSAERFKRNVVFQMQAGKGASDLIQDWFTTGVRTA